MSNILVIGWGNELRGDDGAGIRVSELLSSSISTLSIKTVHQLTPELAETVADASLVFFVDAEVGITELKWRELNIAQSLQLHLNSHALSPESLLAIAHTLYNKVPQKAYCIGIPANSFDFTDRLSPLTEENVLKAVELIKTKTKEYRNI